jgi:glycerophosphoryl diester phosphodiesterase
MSWTTLDGRAPRIIAHRGASGYRPEHTLDGYALAALQGADVLEPDLVMSRDGVLFARHDLGLARSTDVASRPQFGARARGIAGARDWRVSDFDAAEIDTLRAIQPFPERGAQFDGQFIVPRFALILELLTALSAEHGQALALYPELKHPAYFRGLDLDPVAALEAELAPRNLLGEASPVWVQCFDHCVLREVKQRCGNPCFALLETVPDSASELAGLLHDLATWAQGVAPGKQLIWDSAGDATGLVDMAHGAGLEVHTWTFRDDRSPAPFVTPREELDFAFALGVDALFCDFPDSAVAARAAFVTTNARQ